jgi:hypothetical protein
LQQYGFEAIVAPSFADIFRNNCAKIGLLCVELAADRCKELIALASDDPQAQIRIDLPEETVETALGVEQFAIDPHTKHMLVEGLDPIGENGFYVIEMSSYGRGTAFGVGVIHGIFDLSGLQVGSNGMLVILQQESPFQISRGLTADGPAPTVLRSTAPGFSGLPGGLYTSMATDNRQIDFILGSNGYFLIQTDTPPELGTDIDVDNDGLIDPDGIAASWNILDSISLHHGVFQGSVAYGQIAFVERFIGEREPVIAAEGVEVIYTPGRWRYIMWVIRLMPERVFKKLSL